MYTRAIDVPVLMLDTVLERMGVQPDVVKIDAEGAELNIIKGVLKTIAKGIRLIVVESHRSDAKLSIKELLQNLGYVMSEESKFLFFSEP
jgi:arsenate reductase-like glutaredoxin family protein